MQRAPRMFDFGFFGVFQNRFYIFDYQNRNSGIGPKAFASCISSLTPESKIGNPKSKIT
jgi:hypothetical protein